MVCHGDDVVLPETYLNFARNKKMKRYNDSLVYK